MLCTLLLGHDTGNAHCACRVFSFISRPVTPILGTEVKVESFRPPSI